MIALASELPALRLQVGAWKRAGLRIALVPTMGNLHAGHASLITLARAHADRVVASVFVNPTQFGPGEDFERYPRTPQADAGLLDDAGCDLLWLPSVEVMYPCGVEMAVRVSVPRLTDALEGAHRPGHFDGVATVVTRLFNQVQPDVAVFGRKDYQQLAVLRHLARDLAFPVELVAADTMREQDGLAMSSRNQYLSDSERATASAIHATLLQMQRATMTGGGGMSIGMVEEAARARLESLGFVVDYTAVRNADLTPVDSDTGSAAGAEQGTSRRVALIAAKLGQTRLIDNLEFAC